MSADPDAPYDYARERHDAENHAKPHVWDEAWNGQNWSEKPDRSEWVGER